MNGLAAHAESIGVPWRRRYKRGKPIPTLREKEMYGLFLEGNTLNDIGKKYGISRERARQIIKKTFGFTAKDNLKRSAQVTINRYLERKDVHLLAIKNREETIFNTFGCHEEIVTYINGKEFQWSAEDYGCPAWAYVIQKRTAANRSIGWNLTFPQWWEIWQQSGKYNERGRGRYMMARYGDSGPYDTENVYICTASENFMDAWKYKSEEELALWRERIRNAERPKRPLQTHCRLGHELAGENLYVYTPTGQRYCRECQRVKARERYWVNRLSLVPGALHA